jgi:hypothetical protein
MDNFHEKRTRIHGNKFFYSFRRNPHNFVQESTPNLFYIIMNTHTSKLYSKKVCRTSLSKVTFVDRTVLTESDS